MSYKMLQTQEVLSQMKVIKDAKETFSFHQTD